MADDEHDEDEKLHNSEKKLHNSAGEDSEAHEESEELEEHADDSKPKEAPTLQISLSEAILLQTCIEGSKMLQTLGPFDLARNAREMQALQAALNPYVGSREQPRAGADSDKQLSFKKEDLDQYVEHRTVKLAVKSRYWISRAAQEFWDCTRGVISHETMSALRTFVLNKYETVDSHSKVLSFAKAFLKHLAQLYVDEHYLSFTLQSYNSNRC